MRRTTTWKDDCGRICSWGWVPTAALVALGGLIGCTVDGPVFAEEVGGDGSNDTSSEEGGSVDGLGWGGSPSVCPPDSDCRTHGPVPDCEAKDAPADTPCGKQGADLCDGEGECVGAKLAGLGDQCIRDSDCSSNHCIEGASGDAICCDTACDGACTLCTDEGHCDSAPSQDGSCDLLECENSTACTTDCPCEAGEGICTDTEQCAEGLVCTPDAEAKLGSPGSSCMPAHCVNDEQDSGETSVDCGGGCGCRATYEVVQISGVPADATELHLYAMAGDGSAFAALIGFGKYPFGARIDANGRATELDGFGSFGYAFAISDDGSVLAGNLWCEDPPACTVQSSRPFLWTDGEPTAISATGTIRAMSASGAVMAGDGYPVAKKGVPQGTETRAFRVSGSSVLIIHEMFSVSAISADGEFIAGRSTSHLAALWSATKGIVSLNPPEEWTSWDIDVLNANGSVFAGRHLNGEVSRPFIWRDGTFVDFPQLPGANTTYINGMSSSGMVVAGSSGTQATRAFLWDEANGIRTVLSETVARGLELPTDLDLASVDFLSSDGRVLVGYNHADETFWRVTLLP